MKEKLQEYALLAEIISAFAVVITLLILIVEVRENTDTLKTSSYQSQLEKFNGWREVMLLEQQNMDIFLLYSQGKIPDQGTSEYIRLNFILSTLWGNYDSAYASFKSGMFEDNEWNRIKVSMCLEYETMHDRKIEDIVYLRISSDLIKYIESECS